MQARHETDKVLLQCRGSLVVCTAGGHARELRGALRRGYGHRLHLDRLARLVVQHKCEVDGCNEEYMYVLSPINMSACILASTVC
jgi:hypothetical protein